jgi:phospholipase/carboxylesterase
MAKTKKLEFLKRDGEQDGRNVILLHGFGADASDLFPLADVLDPDGGWNFYFPQAPLEVPIGPGWTGRAWFPIPLRELEQGIDYSRARPPGIDDARQTVEDLIFDLNSKSLILGGFSQGAMLAVETAVRNHQDVAGLILYSGALLDAENWAKRAVDLKGKPFIQSHGTADQVIPVSSGNKLFEMLKKAGLVGGLFAFQGGHEIPMPVLKKTVEFLGQFND